MPGNRLVRVTRLGILFEAAGAEPAAHRVVELVTDQSCGKCEVQGIECVAGEEPPGFYHGVIEADLGTLAHGEARVLGTLRFPPGLGAVTRFFLVCGYETA